MWGQGLILRHAHDVRGIIPTRVGTSKDRKSKRTNRQDHPHACGDKDKGDKAAMEEKGSSPRVWGQVLLVVLQEE